MAHTIADERAMMIHSHDALAANGAVVGPRRLYPAACTAIPIKQKALQISVAVGKAVICRDGFMKGLAGYRHC